MLETVKRVGNWSGRDHTEFSQSEYERMREHFILRLKERYDISIVNEEYDELCKSALKSNNRVICKIDCGKNFHIIPINEKPVLVLYSKDYHIFYTCYPMAEIFNPEYIIPSRYRYNQNKKELAIREFKKVMTVVELEHTDLAKEDYRQYKGPFNYYSTKCSYPVLNVLKHKDKLTIGAVWEQVKENLELMFAIPKNNKDNGNNT
jgi:hypothetical protein